MNFDDKAKEWDKDPKRVERARLFAIEIGKMLGENKELNGLEFGSGTGLVSFELTDRFRSITLADSSRGMLEVLEKKIENEKVSIMKPFLVTAPGSLRKLAGFDVIYSLLTLHHIKDIPTLFSELLTILNPGGHLFFGDLFTEDGSFHASDPEFDGHKGFDPDELLKLLKLNGFTNCRSKTLFNIERENNSIVKKYPLFFISAQKKK